MHAYRRDNMFPADKRFVIPVYQRKYDWKYENCRKLYDDLKKVISMRRKTHFFGNIVSQIVPEGSKIEYHIIDGQQRLTTISLLLLAMKNLVEKGLLKSEENGLCEQIIQRFLMSPWAKTDDKIKLRPVKSDRDATNALNKIFLMLNREVLRFDNTAKDYVAKFIYVLLSKRDSGIFPSDEEFSQALSNKQVYKMTGKYKIYLFERFENYGTIEAKDVYTQLDNGVYTLEHIMPQRLTPAWAEALGTDCYEIHKTWLHRLANLTLSGYNPNLSNKTFTEKRDAIKGGYKTSGLKMNIKIAAKNQWGLAELEERNKEMIAYALNIWSYPHTEFKPVEKEFDSCALDDESIDFTGRNIRKYSLLNTEHPASSWTDMFEQVLKFLHNREKSILSGLAYSKSEYTDLVNYVSNDENNLRSAIKIDENVLSVSFTSFTVMPRSKKSCP